MGSWSGSVWCGLAVALLLAASPGGAEELAVPAPAGAKSSVHGGKTPAPPAGGDWYGWQIMVADAASIGALVVHVETDSMPVFVASTALYGVGPLVRTLHHDGGGWSLMRRLLFPPAGGLLGLVLASVVKPRGHSQSNDCGEECAGAYNMMFIGAGIGAVAAMAFDWFATEEPPPDQPAPAMAWAPVVVMTPRAQMVGLALQF